MSSGHRDPAKRKTRRRVLIVEDDPAILALLERALQMRYTLETARDGAEALAKAASHPPALIITDVMMPGIDGFGLAQRLKLHPKLARVPIIFLTAKDAPLDVVRGIQLGARHYLTKPFRLADLLAKVAKLLGP